MPEYLPDPEMERLIQEMNRLAEEDRAAPAAEPPGLDLDDPLLGTVVRGEALSALLEEMVARRASDLILVPGSAPVLRVEGRLHRLELPAVTDDGVGALFAPHLGARSKRLLLETGATDFSLNLSGGPGRARGARLRVNLHRQRGQLAAAVRALPHRVPSPAELGLPEHLVDLVRSDNGLVLVCGPTGAGKSTTLAALLDHLNRTRFCHVITIEEPVEYVHADRSSVFEQVEVGRDSPSFAAALRSALRRDPDVILVGEMRDLETMATAITAAETGHLILSTLHTSDCAQAVNRMIDVYPAGQQGQIRQQLSLSLRAVVCQQLVPTADGRSRVPAFEVLLATYAVRNHIRRNNPDRLYNELVAGRGRGMVSMEQTLADLVAAGVVSADEARVRSSRPDELERMLAG